MIAQSESAFKAILRKMQMKKLPLALCTILASTAYAAPTIYGSGFTGFIYEPVTTATTNLTTNVVSAEKTKEDFFRYPSIRLGLEGSEEINDKLSIEYKLEYEADVEKDKVNLTPRDTYIGLAHKNYGEIQVGRIPTLHSNIDSVDNSYLYAQGADSPFSYGFQRLDNAIVYKSPKFNSDNTQIMAQYAFRSDKGDVSFTTRDWVNKSYIEVKRELASVGLSHKMGKSEIKATYTQAGKDFKALRGVVSGEVNDKLNVGIMGQMTDYFASSKSAKELGAMVGVTYQYSEPLGLYAQAGYATNYGGHPEGKKAVGSIGVTYGYNDKITLYASASGVNSTEIDHAFDDETKLYKNEKQDIKAMGIETGVSFSF